MFNKKLHAPFPLHFKMTLMYRNQVDEMNYILEFTSAKTKWRVHCWLLLNLQLVEISSIYSDFSNRVLA